MSAAFGSARGAAAARVAVLGSAGALVGGLVLLASSAQAAYEVVPETGTAGRLVLLSDPAPAHFPDLAPGDVRYWQVAATIQGAERASLVLELRRSGDLLEHPDGLVVSIERCDVAWTGVDEGDPVCSSGRASVTRSTPATDPASGPVFDLDGVDADGTHLLVELGLGNEHSGDESLMGLTGEIGLGLTAAADEPGVDQPAVAAPPPAGLPVTGTDPTGLVLTALGAIGLGAVLAATRTRPAPARRTVRSEGAVQRVRRGPAVIRSTPGSADIR
jgi:hypothetical protein